MCMLINEINLGYSRLLLVNLFTCALDIGHGYQKKIVFDCNYYGIV